MDFDRFSLPPRGRRLRADHRAGCRADKAPRGGENPDRTWRNAIILAPTEAKIYGDRGLERMGIHDSAGAYCDFEKTLSLNPKNVYAYYGRGLIRTGRGDYDGAIADLDTAIKRDPRMASLYKARSQAWAAKGKRKRAEAYHRKALSLGAR